MVSALHHVNGLFRSATVQADFANGLPKQVRHDLPGFLINYIVFEVSILLVQPRTNLYHPP